MRDRKVIKPKRNFRFITGATYGLEWNMLQNGEMVKDKNYFLINNETYVNLIGFIVLVSNKITTKYDEVALLMKFFFKEEDKNTDFLYILKEMIEKQLNGAETKEEAKKEVKKEKPLIKYQTQTESSVPKLSDPEGVKWSAMVRERIHEYVNENQENGGNLTFSLALRKIYKIMADTFHIDFDLAKKEFLKSYSLPESTEVSVFRIISETASGRKFFDDALLRFIAS